MRNMLRLHVVTGDAVMCYYLSLSVILLQIRLILPQSPSVYVLTSLTEGDSLRAPASLLYSINDIIYKNLSMNFNKKHRKKVDCESTKMF